MELSVIIPCYNEEDNIPLITERFMQSKPKELDAELILVDNGSKDNSNKIIRNLSKKYSCIRLVEVKENIGYGFGVWSGLKKAKSKYLCWTHADMQTDPADSIKAYKIIINQKNPEKCFIKGNRKKRSLFDAFFMVGMSVFETIILRRGLYDINAQPNLFHKTFLNRVKNPPKDFSFDLYFYYIAKKLAYRIIRFPVLFPKRIHGQSHWNTTIKEKWKFIKRTIDFTFRLKKELKNADNNPQS